jgi:hypothetical protein
MTRAITAANKNSPPLKSEKQVVLIGKLEAVGGAEELGSI